MRSSIFGLVGGAAFGAAAYLLLQYVIPEVRPVAYSNVVGIAAAVGVVFGLYIARRTSGRASEYKD